MTMTDSSRRFRRMGGAKSVTAAVLTALYGQTALADDAGLQETVAYKFRGR